MEDYRKRITVNPKVMLGKPVIKGTRIPVYLILGLLAAGYDFKKIIKAYPILTKEDVIAALKFSEEKLVQKTFKNKVFA